MQYKYKGCLCSPQDNREKGEIPLRSRRCVEGAIFKNKSLAKLGRQNMVWISESEDLPFISKNVSVTSDD